MSDIATYPLTSPRHAEIEYRDATGTHTRREITVHAVIHQSGNLRLSAWCHERQAPRDFRIDRITAFITRDGEVLPPADLLRQIPEVEAARRAAAVASKTTSEQPPARSARAPHRLSRGIFIAAALAGIAIAALLSWVANGTPGLVIFGVVIVAGPIAAIGLIVRAIERALRRRNAAAVPPAEPPPATPARTEITPWYRPPRQATTATAVPRPVLAAARQDLTGQKIVFTGQLATMTRPEAVRMAKAAGAVQFGTVSDEVTLVVVGYDHSERKVTRARKLGIRMLNEAQFRALLGFRD